MTIDLLLRWNPGIGPFYFSHKSLRPDLMVSPMMQNIFFEKVRAKRTKRASLFNSKKSICHSLPGISNELLFRWAISRVPLFSNCYQLHDKFLANRWIKRAALQLNKNSYRQNINFEVIMSVICHCRMQYKLENTKWFVVALISAYTSKQTSCRWHSNAMTSHL